VYKVRATGEISIEQSISKGFSLSEQNRSVTTAHQKPRATWRNQVGAVNGVKLLPLIILTKRGVLRNENFKNAGIAFSCTISGRGSWNSARQSQ
jgi:hypothetical protein